MPYFSATSEKKLATCHPNIITICRTVIQDYDFTILCGYRDKISQNAAYPKYTTVKYPGSKHNKIPSLAIDIIPYDHIRKCIVPWDAYEEMAMLAGHMLMAAYMLGIKIRWGHDWNKNGILWDEKGKLIDRPHFELI